MFATIPTRFPEFVADQILTAQNLQDLFNYLDEQERLTRTNLIGIGIVCGLEVFVSSPGNAITITQGVGVTSAGYLVAVPQRTYTFFGEYNAEKDRYYDRFVDPTTKKQRIPIWELAVAGTPEAKTGLDQSFLKDKVVLIFVELVEIGNKNCDPDSCDDKGITVDVVFRPLLVEEANVAGLIGALNGDDPFKTGKPCVGWAEVKMPRYNVPATTLPDSASILKNYLMLLNEAFLQKIENTLTAAYATLQLMVAADFNQNPFTGLTNRFAFLYDGSLGVPQVLNVQYYYDFFSDLLQAYDELRLTCQRHGAVCCPDENLFPRHLLLGAAFNSATTYRHYFLPSPALGDSYTLVGELRFLFARLVQLVRSVDIPAGAGNGQIRKVPIVITPSKLGDVPLSQKAIPYYYDVLKDPALFDGWNFTKTQNGKGNTNLSYHAQQYNATDDHVRFPLRYELEPYNFFRIEGHIGLPWQTAFRQIYQLKQQHRLAFDVVALNGDFRSLIALLQQSLNNLGKVLAEQPEKWRQILCYFNDIEMQYDMQAAELRCTLGKVIRFLYDQPFANRQGDNNDTPVSQLLRKFDPNYKTKRETLGEAFDQWYPTVKDQPYITSAVMLQSSVITGAAAVLSPLSIMYYLEKIHEALPDGIIQLNITDLTARLQDACVIAERLIDQLLQQDATGQSRTNPELLLHLNAVVRVCKGSVMAELYRNFLFRFYLFMANQSFAMFSFLNSGIQHKAGVPVGGTFILVYHDALPQRNGNTNIRDIRGELTASFRGSDTTSGRADSDRVAEGPERIQLTNRTAASRTAFADIKSVKETGIFWLTQLITARSKEDELTDKELLEVVAEIQDGVVIADFYLPYVCASECAPMSYIVLGEDKGQEPPVQLRITLEPDQFCVIDRKEYPITVSPAGGEVKGEGVKKNADGAFVFVPATVNVGADASKAVTLTYEQGGQSVTTTVTVFLMPKADFDSQPATTSPMALRFINRSQFGQTNEWNFGDGGTSTAANPTHTYSAGGTFSVTLSVTNGPCSDETKKEVSVREPVTLKCTDLTIWRDAFAKLNSQPARVLARFRNAFPGFGAVSDAFGRVDQLLPRPQDEQQRELAQIMPPPEITRWMRELTAVITNPDQVAVRPLALELFRVLIGVVMFFSCVQKNDIDKEPVPTFDLWAVMTDGFIRSWQNAAANFTPAEREIVARMIDDAKAEFERTEQQEVAKRRYLEMLKRLIDILNSL
ncbi:hypothetical protein GCM10023189_35820 [Nibrella saemangeumensis]|uniref:PKD domain-containing protein n=1 Tax=Nibrella saemangeumensis TaxID=1084526 RepID=A0ABP8N389_9BACT